MKKITITYLMKNKKVIAETCITLPMIEYIADDILKNGADKWRVIRDLLEHLAVIQGNEYIGSVDVEEAKR